MGTECTVSQRSFMLSSGHSLTITMELERRLCPARDPPNCIPFTCECSGLMLIYLCNRSLPVNEDRWIFVLTLFLIHLE